VYRVRDDLALVLTIDFFTPIVDDPYDWGRIAATNALSDVYAMGGAPLLALNLVAWPREGLPFALLARVIDGGADVARAAGALIAGGHSIDDAEPKYGLAVVGTVEPDRVWSNAGGRAGDVLVLTKPIGLGVISTAVKREVASPELLATAVDVMTTLNAGARDAGRAFGAAIHGATDVTGFGLLGHLGELARGSGVGARLERAAVPVIAGVPELLHDGFVAGGTQRNHAFVSSFVDWGTTSSDDQLLLADAQTSGGLLFAVDPDAADALVAGLRRAGTLAAARIGQLTADPAGTITVT
jgi:selenide,water dikinase